MYCELCEDPITSYEARYKDRRGRAFCTNCIDVAADASKRGYEDFTRIDPEEG